MGRPFTGLTLFSGGGLFESGLVDAIEFVGAVEMDPKIAAHYASVWGDHVTVADVATVDYRPFAGVDHVHGSPSCKNASNANPTNGETPGDLAAGAAVERAIREVNPSCFTLENVQAYQHFDAFKGICRTLTEQGYTWDAQTLNAADWGVPQTRRRLYLRAWRKRDNLPILSPTHCERGKLNGAASIGDLFGGAPLLPWNGWYAAIEDLLPTLPSSEFARWQLECLPKEWEGGLLAHGTADNPRFPTCGEKDPAFTILTGTTRHRAFIVDGQETILGTDGRRLAVVPHDSEPSITITSSVAKGMPRAFLVGVNGEHGELCRPSERDAQTVTANHDAAKVRAWLEQGRVVSMTDRCLARFQDILDDYPLPSNKRLSCTIIGNGVARRMARVVALPLLEAFR